LTEAIPFSLAEVEAYISLEHIANGLMA